MIKTVTAILMSGAMGAGGAVAYTHYTAPPPLDLSLLHNDLVGLQGQMKQTNNALLTSLNSQNSTLANMNAILQRAEAERLALRAQAKAENDRFHSDMSRTINAIPK